MTLIVERQKAARTIEFRVVAHRREEIQNLAIIWSGISHSVRRKHRQLQRTSNANRSLIPPLLLTFLMPLQFDIDIPGTEDANQSLDGFAACLFTTAHQSSCQWAFITSRQAHQAGCILLKIIEVSCALLFRRLPHFELRDELTEVLIAFAGLAQSRGRRAGSATC